MSLKVRGLYKSKIDVGVWAASVVGGEKVRSINGVEVQTASVIGVEKIRLFNGAAVGREGETEVRSIGGGSCTV